MDFFIEVTKTISELTSSQYPVSQNSYLFCVTAMSRICQSGASLFSVGNNVLPHISIIVTFNASIFMHNVLRSIAYAFSTSFLAQ